jgi:L-ascorbate metabolism protein UlaG (beta-lactamase superfamily)
VAGDHRIRVTAVPGRHGPAVVDFAMPDTMGSILDLQSPQGSYRIYVSGDTLVFDDLHEIPRRYEGIDLGLFHLGGTRVAGIMVTMDGEQGVEAVRIIAPELAIPIHYDDYDRFTSPLSDFLDEVRGAGLEERVVVLPRGESFPLGTQAATVNAT